MTPGNLMQVLQVTGLYATGIEIATNALKRTGVRHLQNLHKSVVPTNHHHR